MFWLGAILGFVIGEFAMSAVIVLVAAGHRRHVEPPAELEDEIEPATPVWRVELPDAIAHLRASASEQAERRRVARAHWN